MDPFLLVLTCIISALAIFLIFFDGRYTFRRWTKTSQTAPSGTGRRRAGGTAARRQLTAAAQPSSSSRADNLNNQSRTPGQSSSFNNGDDSNQLSEDERAEESSKKKIGTKKALKLAEKERRKEEREAEELYRDKIRKAEDEEIRKRKMQEEAAVALEAAEKAKAEKLRLEEEARQQAEYELLKSTFLVEAEGTNVKSLDAVAEEELNRSFVRAIEEAKIIPLEHLCVEFEMKTDACIEKIRTLIARKMLSGVLDDRGKFIHICESEYEEIAKYIDLRGRVSIGELVEQGNKILKSRLAVEAVY